MDVPPLDRDGKRRLAIIRHVEEVTGNVSMTCRYFIFSTGLNSNDPTLLTRMSTLGTRSHSRSTSSVTAKSDR
ncbi:hypothetical protein [Catellatospora sichuanensis]|uniref:hypothetical protein n=1 Tax=Catellatospora sichuanensis TaxID=1969805 RepID=UPI001FEC7BEA|nr:hypothetical protein [Catellatospora sichuanensis]